MARKIFPVIAAIFCGTVKTALWGTDVNPSVYFLSGHQPAINSINPADYLGIDESSVEIGPLYERYGGIEPTITMPGSFPATVVPAQSKSYQLDVYTDVCDIPVTLDRIVNPSNTTAWDIVYKNWLTPNTSLRYVSAVPEGIHRWTQLQGWNIPRPRRYLISARNKHGDKILEAVYQVRWLYGGNLRGKGRFLAGVTIEPLVVNAPWGHQLTLTAEVPDSSVGNVGAAEDPVAFMWVRLHWRISMGYDSLKGNVQYGFKGDGLLMETGEPFRRSIYSEADRKFREASETVFEVIRKNRWNEHL